MKNSWLYGYHYVNEKHTCFRKNNLKKEIDYLRFQNDYLSAKCQYFESACREKDLFIRQLKLELENKNLLNRLTEIVASKPTKVVMSNETKEDYEEWLRTAIKK